MLAQSPVVKGFEQFEVVFAKDQPQYMPLPVLPLNDGQVVISRWRMTWKDRLRLLWTGNVYLWIWSFGRPILPVAIECDEPCVIPDGYKFPEEKKSVVPTPIAKPCKFAGCKNLAVADRMFCADHIAMGARPIGGK
jgi:hypothetical protein